MTRRRRGELGLGEYDQPQEPFGAFADHSKKTKTHKHTPWGAPWQGKQDPLGTLVTKKSVSQTGALAEPLERFGHGRVSKSLHRKYKRLGK